MRVGIASFSVGSRGSSYRVFGVFCDSRLSATHPRGCRTRMLPPMNSGFTSWGGFAFKYLHFPFYLDNSLVVNVKMHIFQYLLTTLALTTLHATIICARPPEPPPDQYPHSFPHRGQSGLHFLLPKQPPGRSLPTLHPRENLAWTLNDGWTFFLTTFAQTLPIEEASSTLQGMYSALQTFSQSRSSSFDGPTRDAVSLSFQGLGTCFQSPMY